MAGISLDPSGEITNSREIKRCSYQLSTLEGTVKGVLSPPEGTVLDIADIPPVDGIPLLCQECG